MSAQPQYWHSTPSFSPPTHKISLLSLIPTLAGLPLLTLLMSSMATQAILIICCACLAPSHHLPHMMNCCSPKLHQLANLVALLGVFLSCIFATAPVTCLLVFPAPLTFPCPHLLHCILPLPQVARQHPPHLPLARQICLSHLMQVQHCHALPQHYFCTSHSVA